MKSTVAIGLVVIIAVAAGAAYLLTSNYGVQTGTVQVGVTDSPLPSNVTAIYLTITDISFQSTNNTTATFKVNSTQFNLLSLQNVTKMLGSDKLPVGNYTMIRFNITSATATIAGSNHTLTVPSGVLKVTLTSQKLQVKSGETTRIVLDITPVMTRISSSYNLRPEVTVRSITGPG